jgi:predicted N-acetyltransferase YhbS
MTKRLRIVSVSHDAPFAIRHERAGDAPAREALLDACFGAGRLARTCQRLREGRLPADGLAFTAMQGERLIGTVRLWNVAASGASLLMLGPLAVDPACRSLGLGAALMTRALEEAAARGHAAVVLLGDAAYYARFGFSVETTGALFLPGPFERERLLGLELQAGALEGARGVFVATGRRGHRDRRVALSRVA